MFCVLAVNESSALLWLNSGTGISSSLASLEVVESGMIYFPFKILFPNTMCSKMTDTRHQKGYFSNSKFGVWQFVIFCMGTKAEK